MKRNKLEPVTLGGAGRSRRSEAAGALSTSAPSSISCRTPHRHATVLALSVALDSATAPDRMGENLMAITKGEPRVLLADLVAFDGLISVTDEFNPPGQRVTEYCVGKEWKPSDLGHTATREKWDELRSNPVVDGKTVDWMRTAELQLMRKASGSTEDRLAQRLGVSPGLVGGGVFPAVAQAVQPGAGPNRGDRCQQTEAWPSHARITGRTRESTR
jgi:hypothetical protein